ncbi:MAG TPA: hypothetical protein VJ720_01360, partial [Chitinophaga sp.]|nr:hypothetical protein [Chitinophaga sp.]
WKRVLSGNQVNVKWFGAKGDGTDDTLFLRDCATYCRANSIGAILKRKMYFPEGTYLTGTIDITGIFAIGGADFSSVLIRSKPGEDIFYWKCPGESGYVAPQDITIENLYLKLDRTDANGRTKNGRVRIGFGGERIANAGICLPGYIGHNFNNVNILKSGDPGPRHGDCGIFYSGPAYKVNFGAKTEIRDLDYGIVVGLSELFTKPNAARTVTANAATNTFTLTSNPPDTNPLTNGARVVLMFSLKDGDAISGIVGGKRYYVVNSTTINTTDSTFQLSKTQGGAVIDFSVTGEPTITVVPAGQEIIPRIINGFRDAVTTGANTGDTFLCDNKFELNEQVALIFNQNERKFIDATTNKEVILPRRRYYVVNPDNPAFFSTDGHNFQLSETSGGTPISFKVTDSPAPALTTAEATADPGNPGPLPIETYVIPAGANSIEYACDEWAAEQLITAATRRVGFSVPNLAQSVFNTFGCQSWRVSARILAYQSTTRYEPRSVEFSELYTEGAFDTKYMAKREFAILEGTQIRVANGPKCQYGEVTTNNTYITINTNYSEYGMMEVDDGNKIIITGSANTIRAGVQSKEKFIDDLGVNNRIQFIKSYNGLDATKEISYLSRYSVNQPLGGYWPDHIFNGLPDAPYQSKNVFFHQATNQLFYNNPAIVYKNDPDLDVNGYVSIATPAQLAIRNPLGSISNTFSIGRFFPKARWILYAKVKSPDTPKEVTIAFQRLDSPGSFGASRKYNVETSWQIISVVVDHADAPADMTGQIYVSVTTGGLDLAYFVVVPDTMANQKTGTFTASGNGTNNLFTIAHGIDIESTKVPSYFQVTAASAGAKNIGYVEATSSALNVYYDTPPPSGTNNITLIWAAKE